MSGFHAAKRLQSWPIADHLLGWFGWADSVCDRAEGAVSNESGQDHQNTGNHECDGLHGELKKVEAAGNHHDS